MECPYSSLRDTQPNAKDMPQINEKANISDLFLELKNYYESQKEHKTYLIAEQLTRVISSLAIIVVVFVMVLVIFMFLGMAAVHWLTSIIDNVSVCYLLYALFLTLVLLIFYLKRRTWVVLPLARLMISVFLKDEEATATSSSPTNNPNVEEEEDDKV